MAEYQRLSEGFNDGMVIGESASDKIGFFGATPVVQQTITHLVVAGDGTTACNLGISQLQTAVSNLGLTTVTS